MRGLGGRMEVRETEEEVRVILLEDGGQVGPSATWARAASSFASAQLWRGVGGG